MTCLWFSFTCFYEHVRPPRARRHHGYGPDLPPLQSAADAADADVSEEEKCEKTFSAKKVHLIKFGIVKHIQLK